MLSCRPFSFCSWMLARFAGVSNIVSLLVSGLALFVCLAGSPLRAAPNELRPDGPGEDVPLARSVSLAHRLAHPRTPLPVWHARSALPPAAPNAARTSPRGVARPGRTATPGAKSMPSGSGGPNVGPSVFDHAALNQGARPDQHPRYRR